MKLFKSSILAIFALVAGASFTSCSDDNNIVDAPDTGLYIMSQGSQINIPDDGSDVVLTIARHSVEDESSVAVSVSDEKGIFTGPATVEFEGDALTTTYHISYDNSKIEEDVKYNIEVKLDPTQASHYGVYDYNVALVRLSPWTSLGKAIYTDDIIASVYTSAGNETYEVEIQENDKTPGLYRLVNPYGKAYPLNEPGDYDDTKDYYFVIDASNPDRVNVTMTHTGLDWGIGEIMFQSRAQFYMDNGNSADAVYKAGWFGKLENGIITFPVKGFVIGAGDGEYAYPYWYGNANGAFKVVLPGTDISDYTANIEYNGRFVDANDANSAVLNITLGADVESARVAGQINVTDADALAAAIIGDQVEYAEIAESGEVRLPVTESGVYTFVVVTYAGGEVKEAAAITININLGNAGDWETAGSAMIYDGWMLAASSQYDPSKYIWYVDYQLSPSNPGLVKLVSMYGASSPMADFSLGKFDIVVDASDPNYVIIEPQCTGNEMFSNGIAYISNAGYIYTEVGGNTKQQVIDAGLAATYTEEKEEDGSVTYMIEFPANSCFINFGGEDWYKTKSQGGILLMPESGEDTEALALNAKVSHKKVTSAVKASASKLHHPALVSAKKNVTAKKVSNIPFNKAK